MGNDNKYQTFKWRTVIIILFLLGSLALGIILALTTWGREPVIPPILVEYRVNCIPDKGDDDVELSLCESRGCLYNGSILTAERVPKCFYPLGFDPDTGYGLNNEHGYLVIGEPNETYFGDSWLLKRKSAPGIFKGDVDEVRFDVEYRDNNILRFKFDDATRSDRYKVPLELNLGDEKARDPQYEVEVYNTETFSFLVRRKSTKTVIWDSGVGAFTFSDQFLQISTALPSFNLFGFGENQHQFFSHDMEFQTWPMFARNQPPSDKQENLYSVHPFYECIEDDGHAHGVLLLNSNAMDYTLTPAPMITLRSIGGILDFYIFMGPTPEMVIQQYTGAIGRPFMPPYWSLGYQLSNNDFYNISNMKAAVDRTVNTGIPLDVIYANRDTFYKNRDFTIDSDSFPNMTQFLQKLNSQGIKTIISLDPALEVNNTYEPYLAGLEHDVYVKWYNLSTRASDQFTENMHGFLWTDNKVVFLDFFSNSTNQLWQELLVNHSSILPFDGVWLEMNAPANFYTNENATENGKKDTYFGLMCIEDLNMLPFDDPPYETKAVYVYREKERELGDDADEDEKEAEKLRVEKKNNKIRLSTNTLCMQATHADGLYQHYDVHNLYGWSQTRGTFQ